MDYLHVQADNPWYNYYLFTLPILTAKLNYQTRNHVAYSFLIVLVKYSKTCVKRPLEIDKTKMVVYNEIQKYCRMLPLERFCYAFDLH